LKRLVHESKGQKKKKEKLGIATHACNPSIQEDHKFKANLGYIARPCLKKEKKRRHKLTALCSLM
jgi:hypothetical protein